MKKKLSSSGWDTAGRAVASDARDPSFEPRYRQFSFTVNCIVKEAGYRSSLYHRSVNNCKSKSFTDSLDRRHLLLESVENVNHHATK